MKMRVLLTMAVFFFLPAALSFPGRAYYFAAKLNDINEISGPHALLMPSILLALALLVVRSPEAKAANVSGQSGTYIALAMVIWFLAGTLSTIANYQVPLVPLFFVATYLATLLLYLALRAMPMTRRDLDKVYIALSLGCLFPLVLGLYGFYIRYGVPGMDALLLARYDMKRMAPYQQLTFGNTSSTAAFLMLVGPLFLGLTLDSSRARTFRGWFLIMVVLVVLHLLIVQARAAWLVILLLCPVFLYFRKPSKLSLIAMALVLVGLMIQSPSVENDTWTKFSTSLTTAATADEKRDRSVRERKDSIREGWQVFLQNWSAGVGPGASRIYSKYTAAHQFNVFQAVEAGVLGLIGSVLLVLAVLARTSKILVDGANNAANRERFVLIMGPAAFLVFGVVADIPLAVGPANIWIGLTAAMLALVDFRAISEPGVAFGEANQAG